MTVYVVEWSNWATNAVIGVELSIEVAKDVGESVEWQEDDDGWVARPRDGEEYTITPWEVG